MEAEIAECLRSARLPELQFSEDRPVSVEDFPEGGKRRILESMERGIELLGQYNNGSSISQTVARSIYAPLILVRLSVLFSMVARFSLEKLNARNSRNLSLIFI